MFNNHAFLFLLVTELRKEIDQPLGFFWKPTLPPVPSPSTHTERSGKSEEFSPMQLQERAGIYPELTADS